MKLCKTCGRARHPGLCDMAELTDGRTVHMTRLQKGGDLYDDHMRGVFKVKNKWIKHNFKKKKSHV